MVLEAAEYKTDSGAVAAPGRRAEVMSRLMALADQEGVAPEVVTAVWTAMIDAFIVLEAREQRRVHG